MFGEVGSSVYFYIELIQFLIALEDASTVNIRVKQQKTEGRRQRLVESSNSFEGRQ